MGWRRMTAAVLAAMTVTGCALRADRASRWAVEGATDAVEHRVYDSTLEIPNPGFYIVDLSTGRAETWLLKGRAAEDTDYALSEDGRWITLQGDGRIYWVNRETGEAFSWQPAELRLRATAPDRFLLEAVQDRAERLTFHVADGRFRLLQTLTADLGGQQAAGAAFSPDGTQVVLSTSREGQIEDTTADVRVYLVDLATRKVRDLGGPPEPEEGTVVSAELQPHADQLVVSYLVQGVEPTGHVWASSIVRLYSWQGELLAEYPVAGQGARPSPDGRLLVSYDDLGHFADAVVVTDLATGRPLFRVLNAWPRGWTADAADLLLRVPAVGNFLVPREGGDLRPAPEVSHAGTPLVWRAGLEPSPDAPDRFLAGLAVVDGAGTVLRRIELPARDDWRIDNPRWGASGQEVAFTINPLIGQSSNEWGLPMPAAVQKPPFPDPYLLAVQDPQGDCLNLREQPSLQGRIIRCLPTGTRLAVADLSDAPVRLNQAWTCDEQHCWAWVRTEQGENGWVSLSTGIVVWAD